MKNYIKIQDDKIRINRFSGIYPIIRRKLLTGGVFLAGGSLRTLIDPNDQVQDYDLFFESLEKLQETKKKLEELNFKLVFECPEGKIFTYKQGNLKIQCICEYYYFTALEVIQDFDFGACAAVYDGDRLIFHPSFIKDVKFKRLTVLKLTYPVATLNRIVKYKQKGFNTFFASQQYVELLEEMILKDGSLPSERKRVYID